MTTRARLSVLAWLLTACAPKEGPVEVDLPSLTPGDHPLALRVDGLERRYVVHVPVSSAGVGRDPVLLAFHGGGGNPEQFQASAGLDRVADREGLVVVYPAGTGALAGTLTWNAGPGCCGFARDNGIDDVAFVRSLLNELAARHAFDPARVFVVGHSNGSMMAYRIAAEAPTLIAGAVGVAGALQWPAVSLTSAVPMLHIHSEDDPRAFYDGGTRDDREHIAVSAMLAHLVSANGCAAASLEVERRDGAATGPDAGHTATRLRWTCARAPLEHWRLTGAGHAWPGHRVGPLREAIVGPSTEVILAAEEIWRFFSGL